MQQTFDARTWKTRLFLAFILGAVLWLGPGVTAAHAQPRSPRATPATADSTTAAVPPTRTTMPTTRPTVRPTAEPTLSIHIVASGESLSLIAERYEVSVAQIVDANGLQDRNLIRVGQELIIPAPRSPTTAAASEPSPTPAPTNPLFACPQNTRVQRLNLPTDPIRLAIADETLYLIADGDLFRMPLETGSAQRVTPLNLMPPDRAVGQYLIRELVYVTPDPATGDLLMLDKTNDVYRYTVDGVWRMESPAAQIPGQFPDPQFLAIQAAGDSVYALDADLQHIWRLGDGPPQFHLSRSGLSEAVDLAVTSAAAPPQFSVLTQNGAVAQHQAGAPSRILGQFLATDEAWPSQILAVDERLYAADGASRSIRWLDMREVQSIQTLVFRLPGMARLRSFAVQDETLLAVAGSDLYRVALDDLEGVSCPAVIYDDMVRFYGVDLGVALADFRLPVAELTLRMRPRSYPGARRLYRQGVHRGLDIYGLEAPGLRIGSPVRAIADGTAIQVDSDYVEMTAAEYEAAVARAEAEHRTPSDLMQQFQGRQVRIDHGNGVESWYSHLDATAAGLTVGDTVIQGESVGTVGVSGTSSGAYNSSGGAHLHFEIWIDGRYLGQGLSLYETMRVWQALFDPASNKASATPTATSMPSQTPTPPTAKGVSAP